MSFEAKNLDNFLFNVTLNGCQESFTFRKLKYVKKISNFWEKRSG